MITSEELLRQGIIAYDPQTVRLYEIGQTVANTDATILIRGESGTGKDCLAKFIHRNSSRALHPFIHLNCATLPQELFESELFGFEAGTFTDAGPTGKKGLAELADKGTLFLDEIGEISLESQAKLLQFLEDKEVHRLGRASGQRVDVRIICATNRDLGEMVREKLFRKDLLYRINIVQLYLPPLRERPLDLRALIGFFSRQMEKQYHTSKEITGEAMEFLFRQDFVGNIRELQNLMERLYILENADIITESLLEEGYSFSHLLGQEPTVEKCSDHIPTLKEALAEFERQYILEAIRQTSTLAEAAQRLDVDLATLHRKKRQYHLYKRELPGENDQAEK